MNDAISQVPYRGSNPTVWYWIGGTVEGSWRRTFGGQSETALNDRLHALRIAGYVAHIGCVDIGAPDGPPSAEQFADVAT
jgi:hypothetical protein